MSCNYVYLFVCLFDRSIWLEKDTLNWGHIFISSHKTDPYKSQFMQHCDINNHYVKLYFMNEKYLITCLQKSTSTVGRTLNKQQ